MFLHRFMTIQLLERRNSPSRLVISDIEVEGFHRKCGNPCLSRNVADVDDYIGTIGDGVTDWKLVRYTPASSSWHPARDYLRYDSQPDLTNYIERFLYNFTPIRAKFKCLQKSNCVQGN